jgi:L-lactate utilization protein LutC
MDARDEILGRLRGKARPVEQLPAWRSRRRFNDLAERFAAALTAAHGEVLRAGSLAEALGLVDTVLAELGAQKVVANAEQPLADLDLPGRWPDIQWHVAGNSQGSLRDFCATADIGLSGADAALAETGTVVVSSGPGQSRLATLLPPVHLAVVPASRLTTDVFTWAAARQGDHKGTPLPANVVLISGPSKTADIEQTMAIGVHGPKRFIVVLYDGEIGD